MMKHLIDSSKNGCRDTELKAWRAAVDTCCRTEVTAGKKDVQVYLFSGLL